MSDVCAGVPSHHSDDEHVQQISVFHEVFANKQGFLVAVRASLLRSVSATSLVWLSFLASRIILSETRC